MKKIKNENLAQLLLQFKFSPLKQKLKQLQAAEKLLSIIDKEKEYPFEFVCFHITGFRPAGHFSEEIIQGNDLASDLSIFITSLSSRVCPSAAQQNQKVYTIEQLAENIGVSVKTINRWRNRGLLAKKFFFPDARKCLGFLQSSVDNFLKNNPAIISKAKKFKRLTKNEKQLIAKQAASIASKTDLSRCQIIKQLSNQSGISRETIRYTLIDFEKSGKTIFKRPPGVISPNQASEMYKLYQSGTGIKELMEKFNRTKSSVYRIINERKASELSVKKIDYISSDDFLKPDAQETILEEPEDLKKIIFSKKAEPPQNDNSISSYLQTVRSTAVFDREFELAVFRRYNFLKFLASQIAGTFKSPPVQSSKIKQVEKYLSEADAMKKIIIEANLRLVVGIARKHAAASGTNMNELIGEGNLSLLKAVEKFDYTRGFRFITYAAWAIAKDYAHHPAESTVKHEKTDQIENVQKNLRITDSANFEALERTHKSLVSVIKDNLNHREQYVIINHFGLMGTLVKKEKKTLTQIGQELGLTKERVRQIELISLQKLRHTLSAEQFDLLKG